MKLLVSFLFVPLLFISCKVEWSFGVPIPTEGEAGSAASNASSDAPASDQPGNNFPFHDYQNESSSYLVIDDMVIRKAGSRAGLVDAAWPNGIIPYSFALTISPQQRQMILQAQKELAEAVPCIHFRPVTREDTYNIEYRNDAMSGGCSSFVGWQNRKNQPVQLAPVCTKGNAIHEVMHALGFFHEQTRNDRDEYVKINFHNIQNGAENNFKKDGELYPNAETGYFNVPYNYDSIMHYGKTYFSKNGQHTIEVLHNPNALGNGDGIGQRDFISEGDILMMRRKYECDTTGEEAEGELHPPEGEAENGENGEGEETEPVEGEGTTEEGGEAETEAVPEEHEEEEPSTKPTTKNPICNYNPNLPNCKKP